MSKIIFAQKPTDCRFKDITGQKFSRLTVLGLAEMRNGSHWWCECECGSTVKVHKGKLTTGHTKSCGCLKIEILVNRLTTHGKTKHPDYSVWEAMRQRCNNPTDPKYSRYGGRGIKICKRWNNFANFIGDMGNRPNPKFSIHRINNDGDYTPENCIWADSFTQANTKSNVALIEFSGEKLSAAQWGRRLGIRAATIRRRRLAGHPVEKILSRHKLTNQ